MAAYFLLPAEDNGLYEIYSTSISYLDFSFFNSIEKFAERPGIGGGREETSKKFKVRKIFVHTANVVANIKIYRYDNISFPWNVFLETRKRDSIL